MADTESVLAFQHKHSIASRWAHWVNFPILTIMIWSGLLIYWANDIYRVGVGSATAFKFFPQWVYSTLHLDHSLARGMFVHFFFMWIFGVNGLLYVTYTLVSGEWRELVPTSSSFSEAVQVTLHDLGLRKGLPPQGKYNGAQRIAYSAIILMGFGSLLTGLAIYKPIQMAWLTSSLGGYEFARPLHFWLTIGYLLFFVLHVGQVIRAGWNNFSCMVSGFEVVSKEGR